MTLRTSNQLFDAYFTADSMARCSAIRSACRACWISKPLWPVRKRRSAVAPIAQACLASLYDMEALGVAIASAGNSAIPLVKALGKLIASEDAGAERYVHLGATSQDVMGTGLVLQFGGASGTLAALGEQAMPVAQALVAQLQLTLPEQPSHTQRDRLLDPAHYLGQAHTWVTRAVTEHFELTA